MRYEISSVTAVNPKKQHFLQALREDAEGVFMTSIYFISGNFCFVFS
jgi:hypothetical protein